MRDSDKEKISEIIKTRKRANAFYTQRSEVFRSFTDLEQHTFKDGVLSKKQKELIALGISITINCESCIEWHIRQALDEGSSVEEIVEAVGVGIEMSGGPGTVAARFAMNVIEYYKPEDCTALS
jgi:AhpD family alkylhydroperoxidase